MGASLSLTVTESNASQANNTSVVKAVLKITATGETYNEYNKYGYITIDGTRYGFNHGFSKGKTTTLATKTKTITHNADGSKSVTVKGYYETGVSPGNLSKTTTKTLTKITRQFSVTYNANGGSGAPGNQTKTYGVTLKLSTAKPTRSGYTFKGWATSASGSVTYAAGANYTANTPISLYAVWQVNTYQVTFNANGGSGAPAAQTKTYGTTLRLSSTAPTRSGYTFVGWGTSAGTQNASYQPGGNYTGNVTLALYAIWSLDYTQPTINSVSIYRCNSSGEKALSGAYVKMVFTWTAGLTPGVSTYSTKLKVTYGSGTVWCAETTSTNKSETVTAGPTEIEYTPGLTATITITDTKAPSEENGVRTQNVAIPDVGLTVDISPNEDNVTLFGVCDDSKEGLIVNGNIEGKDIKSDNVYAGNIGQVYSAMYDVAITVTGIDTYTVGPHITLPAGTYVLLGWWTFSSSGEDVSNNDVDLSTSSGNTTDGYFARQRVCNGKGWWCRLTVHSIKKFTTTTTVYVKGSSTQPHTAASARVEAIRIA